MTQYVCFKVKSVRENGVQKSVRYDYVENLNADDVRDDNRFPNGMQLEDDGVAFFWGYDEP